MQALLVRLVHAFAARLDRSAVLCFVLLAVSVLPLAVLKSHATRFIGDEVYTLRIAQQPTIRQMIHLSREIDLHPPLHYFVQRAALATPVPVWCASRLPSIVATALTLVFLCLFVARRSGYLMGIFAASIFWFTPAIGFAWLNRPYALWLCLLTLTAVLYQRATEFRRGLWLPLVLSLSGFAMTLDYMAGLPCLLPFFIAEAFRTRRRRTFDVPIWIALTLPCLSLILYLRPVAAFATNSFVPSYLDSFSVVTGMYVDMASLAVAILTGCILAAVVLFSANGRRLKQWTAEIHPEFRLRLASAIEAGQTTPELTIGLCLLALPLLLAAMAYIRQTQFFARYGACAAVGLAICAPWFLTRYIKQPRAVAALMTIAMLITAGVQTASADFEIQGIWRTFQPQGVCPIALSKLNPALPIVVASPVGYTEMNDRESAALLSRTYYLYDRDSAIRFSGSTVFENEYKIANLMQFAGQTAPLYPFLAGHAQFYMIASYTDPEEWLPRKLIASGADLRYLGEFESTYRDVDLFLVTPAATSPPPTHGDF